MSDRTQEEKLKELITKAADNGWCGVPRGYIGPVFYEDIHVNAIIFDHDFARALFGNEDTKDWKHESYRGNGDLAFYDFEGKLYLYHMIGAVTSDNPIDYYYKEVFGKEDEQNG